jgi:RNA polymerase sigma-70 factor (ECF subfamily)
MAEAQEIKWVHASQKGDRSAFAHLIRKYEPKIYGLLLRMTQNEADASDLFQETFISAWKNIGNFKEKSNFSTWIYRIAVNAVLMKWRKKKVSTISMDEPLKGSETVTRKDLIEDWSKNPLTTLENKELSERINSAISLLSEKYRLPFILSDLNGLPNEEIGKVLNLSLSNVKSRIHRARLFLRDHLSDYFKEK